MREIKFRCFIKVVFDFHYEKEEHKFMIYSDETHSESYKKASDFFQGDLFFGIDHKGVYVSIPIDAGGEVVEFVYEEIHNLEEAQKVWDEIKEFQIMQYAGLKDKNKKEIYEGDILLVENFLGIKYKVVVFFSEGSFRLSKGEWIDEGAYSNILQPYSSFEEWLNEGSKDLILKSSEVIGNIYENPELLKEVEKK